MGEHPNIQKGKMAVGLGQEIKRIQLILGSELAGTIIDSI